MSTPILNIDEITAGQASKYATHNTGLRQLEAFTIRILDRDLSTPPGSPSEGDCYYVSGTGTGAWAGHDGELAAYVSSNWEFTALSEGMRVWVNDEDVLIVWDGAAWTSVTGATAFTGLTDTPSSYSGNALDVVRVNAGETGLEFFTLSAGSGDVVGPGSATDNAITRFDGTTGKLIQNSSATIDDSGNIGAGSGSASTPSYSFTADPNTGMYSSGADELSFATAGTQRVLVDSNGQVKVGGTGLTNSFVSLQGTPVMATAVGHACRNDITIDPTVQTASCRGFVNTWNIGASGSITDVLGFYDATFATLGASVTNYYSFFAGPQSVATNNYGFYSNLSSGTGRYNFYAAGTADNYFNGKVICNSDIEANDGTLVRPILKDYGETATSPSSSSNAITLDITNGNHFQITLTENITTLTLSNPTPTGNACSIVLKITQGAGPYTITWPAAVKWPGGTAVTLSTGSGDIDIITLVTYDAGTNWYAMVAGQDFS